jgi:formamidopyrimidine-DNA glycosylase
MPELPDVEVFKRYFARHALHQPIAGVQVQRPRSLGNVTAAGLRSSLSGHAFQSVQRHGKHLFAALDSGAWLAMHFGMTGSLRYFDGPDPEPDYDRVRFDFANGHHLGYNDPRLLGRINLIDDPDDYIADKGLGPDALALTYPVFKNILLAHGNGIAKSVLMDQGALAGIGNIYSDEILFQAGVHPKTKVGTLDERALKALYNATKTVLKKAIERGADPERLPDDYLLPHRRAGEVCPRGGGKVTKIVVGGRSAYYCPGRQPGR